MTLPTPQEVYNRKENKMEEKRGWTAADLREAGVTIGTATVVGMDINCKGAKFDTGKQPWFALPLEILEPLAMAFAAGEIKYDTFNCLKPFDDWSRRLYDGQMRHTRASQIDPLSKDEENGCYHLAQVAFNALIRLHNALREQKEKE